MNYTDDLDCAESHKPAPIKKINNNPIDILTSQTSFDREFNAQRNRKSAYVRSRLPTFGSLTTSKPMHQGSNVAIGNHRRGHHHFGGGGVTQKSDDGRAWKQMTPNEVGGHHHHMTSHQQPSSPSMSFKNHSINSFKAPLSQFSVEAPPGDDEDALLA